MKSNPPFTELLAPAGDWECVHAAVANGADAVYFGLPRFNARLRAENFTDRELPSLMSWLHERGVRGFVAFNTLIFTDELPDAAAQLQRIAEAGVDAIIVQDIGLVRLARQVAPELELHASTQMTLTSPEGLRFAKELGIARAVLARELSLRDMERFLSPEAGGLPLEVFVHGALCVAYSGQCLTSESLGRRSANRGECAQACRMPYEMMVDGEKKDLGDRRYLLSPQDLAAAEWIPDLIRRGVCSFKIEGRLKSPEYVAAITAVYRRAIDAALSGVSEKRHVVTEDERYAMEMTFSRGLYSGWVEGVNHQELVDGRYGKKRGPFVGKVVATGRDKVTVDTCLDLRPGDGVVFDTGGDTNQEQGGRIYGVDHGTLQFERGRIDFRKIAPGTRVWKTNDPHLDKNLRRTFEKEPPARPQALVMCVSGLAGARLRLRVEGGGAEFEVCSQMNLEIAEKHPLTRESLEGRLGRLGGTRWHLAHLEMDLPDNVLLPLGELNRLRREALEGLETQLGAKVEEPQPNPIRVLPSFDLRGESKPSAQVELGLLCRSMEQVQVACRAEVDTIYIDFEDIRRSREAVECIRGNSNGIPVFLATPRIQKPGEQGFFRLVENAGPDGVLIRNLGGIAHFQNCPMRKRGDFSLNVANPLTAAYFLAQGLERLTISYDLNAAQAGDLVMQSAAGALELTIHQQMPMFHMEHCVFAAFLSEGTDHTNCGRPCDRHRVELRDRVGMQHPVMADVGCRNTVFNAVPQTGALFYQSLHRAGLRHFRVDLLRQDAEETRRVLTAYRALIHGRMDGGQLWRELQATSQLGVTRGTAEG